MNFIEIFIFPALAGFLFLNFHPQFKFRFLRLSAEKMVLWTIISGLAFYSSCFYLISAVKFIAKSYPDALISFVSFLPDQFVGTLYGLYHVLPTPFKHAFPKSHPDNAALLCLFIVVAAWVYSACRIRFFKATRIKYYNSVRRFREAAIVIAYEQDPLEDLLQFASRNIIPIAINLKNRKVYIGIVEKIPEVITPKDRAHLNLIPIYSGYRTSEDLTLKIENDYGFMLFSELVKTAKELKQKQAFPHEINLDGDHKISTKYLRHALEHAVVVQMSEILTAHVWIPQAHSIISKRRVSNRSQANKNVTRNPKKKKGAGKSDRKSD